MDDDRAYRDEFEAALKADRDRYKAALEKITSGGIDGGPYAYGSYAHADWVRGVAKTALKST